MWVFLCSKIVFGQVFWVKKHANYISTEGFSTIKNSTLVVFQLFSVYMCCLNRFLLLIVS